MLHALDAQALVVNKGRVLLEDARYSGLSLGGLNGWTGGLNQLRELGTRHVGGAAGEFGEDAIQLAEPVRGNLWQPNRVSALPAAIMIDIIPAQARLCSPG
jgi:hypothetical protein